jgi:hypothetical protein
MGGRAQAVVAAAAATYSVSGLAGLLPDPAEA